MEKKVTVAVRCRPTTMEERNHQEPCVEFFSEEDKKSITTLKNKYSFNHVFTPGSSQNEVFETIGESLVEKVVEGYNGTILAYGQTGSGKSYSMGTEMGASEGLTQKVLAELYKKSDVSVSITSVEIYKEEVFDLLSENPNKISLSHGLRATDLVHIHPNSVKQAEGTILFAMKNRKVGTTRGNIQSSRSHMILTFHVNRAKLNLVDLAGSEKVSENDMARNEGVAINQGLLQLLIAVDSLAKESLSSKNYIALLACINPLKKNLEETDKTLDFASKFASIEVTPVLSSQTFGTPYKTPQKSLTPRVFKNKTFCSSSELFKKPLVPLNRTVATPISWATKRTMVFGTPMDRMFDHESSLNMSNVSTSTAISDRGSPPPPADCTRMPEYNTHLPEPVPMTPDMKAVVAVARAFVAESEKRMTALFERFERKFDEFGHKETWRKKLSKIDLEESLDDVSSATESLSCDENNTTVLGPTLDQGTPKRHPPPSVDPVFKMPQLPVSSGPRRSARLSICTKENFSGSYISDYSYTSDSKGGESDSGLSSSSSEIPPRRRSVRLSICKRPLVSSYLLDFRETPDPKVSRKEAFAASTASKSSFAPSIASKSSFAASSAAKTSVRKSFRVSPIDKEKKKGRGRPAKKVKEEEENNMPHKQKILKILQTGDAKDLVKLPTIGIKTAALILNDRRLNGSLNNLEDFNKIRGLTQNYCKKFLWANSLN